MKKILLWLTLTIAVSLQMNAQGINFEHGTFAEVKEKAKQENKLIFIDFYTVWCGPCKMMSKDVFPAKESGEFYNKNFICYKLDAEKGEGIELAKKFEVIAYPTLFFMDVGEKMIHRTAGGMNPSEFVELGKVALDPEKRLGTLEEKFNSGNLDIKFVEKYFEALKKSWANVQPKLDTFILSLNKEQLLTADIYSMIDTYANNPEGKAFNILLDNIEEYSKLAGKENVDKKVYITYSQSYFQNRMRGGGKGNDELINSIKTRGLEFADKVIEETEIRALPYEKKMTEYFTQAEEFLLKYGDNDPDLLMRFAKSGKYAQDTVLQQKGIEWIEKAIKLGKRDYSTYKDYAYMLSLTTDKELAIKIAEEGIEIGKDEAKDVSYLEGLIKRLNEKKK